MEAGDQQAVASQLRSRGLIVVDIEEQAEAGAGDIFSRFRRVKADDLVIASRQLSTMVQSGMSLLRALYVIEEQTESDKLREILIDVRKDVEGGSVALRVAAQAPGHLQRPLRGDGRGRGDRRNPGPDARARGRAAREGRRAPPAGEGGDDLSDPDRRLRADRAGGARGLPRAGVREDLQGLRRRAARHHEVHRLALAPRHATVVHPDRRGVRRGLALPLLEELGHRARSNGTA